MNTTIAGALRHAQQQGVSRLDAQILLLHTVGRALHDRAWLIAHDTDPLPEAQQAHFAALCQRRLDDVPVAYLTGHKEFHGLPLQVDARVLDPRADTETLVDWALDVLPTHPKPTVVDLGTGSGAIALALQHRRPDAQVWAIDASADALAVAEANAHRLQLPVRFVQSHWLQHWSGPPLDLIVSNPPYIRDDDPHLPALRHEPRHALTSGPDGLDDLRQIVQQARPHLKPGAWLLLEHGWDQGDAVATLLRAHGWHHVEHRHDLAGHLRCTGARA